MRTQETRAIEGLAKILFKLLDKAEDLGASVYEDDKARKALKKLQVAISNWGLD